MVEGLPGNEHLKSLIKDADEQGCLPLHSAAQFAGTKMIKLLLKHNRNAAYIRDNEGRTALHLAPSRFDIFKTIILYCPDCAEIVEKTGKNVLHYANSHRFRHSTAKFILENQSLVNLYNEKDVDGKHPFTFTIRTMLMG